MCFIWCYETYSCYFTVAVRSLRAGTSITLNEFVFACTDSTKRFSPLNWFSHSSPGNVVHSHGCFLRSHISNRQQCGQSTPSPPETKTLPSELIMCYSACFSDWSAKTISASRTNPCNDCLRRGASAYARECVCVCVCVCVSAHSATCTNYLPTVHLLTNLFSDSFNQTMLSTPVFCVVGSPILLKSEVRFFSSE